MLTRTYLVGSQGFPAFNEPARLEAIDNLKDGFEPMRQLAPDTGAYINEVCDLLKISSSAV